MYLVHGVLHHVMCKPAKMILVHIMRARGCDPSGASSRSIGKQQPHIPIGYDRRYRRKTIKPMHRPSRTPLPAACPTLQPRRRSRLAVLVFSFEMCKHGRHRLGELYYVYYLYVWRAWVAFPDFPSNDNEDSLQTYACHFVRSGIAALN